MWDVRGECEPLGSEQRKESPCAGEGESLHGDECSLELVPVDDDKVRRSQTHRAARRAPRSSICVPRPPEQRAEAQTEEVQSSDSLYSGSGLFGCSWLLLNRFREDPEDEGECEKTADDRPAEVEWIQPPRFSHQQLNQAKKHRLSEFRGSHLQANLHGGAKTQNPPFS